MGKGARPLPVHYLALYDSNQAGRHSVRPGITGWAQVNGRNATSWDDRLAQDVWYVEHASPLLDLRILGRTVTTVLSGRDVTPQGGGFMEPFRGPSTKNLAGYASWFIARSVRDESERVEDAWDRLMAA